MKYLSSLENKPEFDVIVVGAGPSGVSAAITVAQADKKVLLIERGDYPGSKNMYGGVMYSHAINEIFPNFLDEAPIERIIRKHNYSVMLENESSNICYSGNIKNDKNISFTALRSKFDKWCVEQAQKKGVIYAPRTLVKNLIVKDNFVVGVKTEIEEIYAPITIIADGVNSLLSKEIGLREDIEPKDVAIEFNSSIGSVNFLDTYVTIIAESKIAKPAIKYKKLLDILTLSCIDVIGILTYKK